MSVWSFVRGHGQSVKLPVAALERLRLVFPAEQLVHRSRGIDRTAHLPTRSYATPHGQWATEDTDLLRLLHNDFPFVIERVARVAAATEFVATSTNYGSNPYYCIRRPLTEQGAVPLFHLGQEDLVEPHKGLSIGAGTYGLHIETVQVTFNPQDDSATDIHGQKLPDDVLIFTAPAIVWQGRFVGWEEYARATYDCRHIMKLQYVNRHTDPAQFERVRAEIQRLQGLWETRERYIDEVLRLVPKVGYAHQYERMMVGVGGTPEERYLLLSSMRGTAQEVADHLIAQCPDIDAAFQITEGGGTGILMGIPADWRVVGPSTYRRGRVLCCLLIELQGMVC